MHCDTHQILSLEAPHPPLSLAHQPKYGGMNLPVPVQVELFICDVLYIQISESTYKEKQKNKEMAI